MCEIVSHQSCLQAFTFNSMWSEGRHFRAHKIDERRTTHDCGVMGNFDTTTEEVRYCGTIERIIKVDFRTFHKYLFECRWFAGEVKRHENGLYMVDSAQFHRGKTDNLVQPSSCEQVNSMCTSIKHYMIHIKLNLCCSLFCDLQVFYVPCMYQRRLWYVIPVTPRSRSIFAETDIETLADITIPSQVNAEEDAVEVDERPPSPTTNHSEEDEDGGDDDDSIGEAIEDESLDFFIDLATMGLDMDASTCRDLLQDEN